MKKMLACAAFAALAACGSQETPAPAPTESPVAVATPIKPSVPAPTQEVFAKTFADACPGAKPVTTSLCKSLGLGKTGFTCDFGFGDDQRQPNTAQIVPEDGKWTLADPEKTCTAAAAA